VIHIDETMEGHAITLLVLQRLVLCMYVGHGTWINDANWDEEDDKDEAIIPADSKLLIDDQIFEEVSVFFLTVGPWFVFPTN